MLDNTDISPATEMLRFKVRVEDGVLIPEEGVSLPDGTFWMFLQGESGADLDALDEIAALAQPLGPSDLARNFDTYTGRLISDETSS